MLNKYQGFYKLSRSNECSIYTAFNRQSANNVLIKRIKTTLAWKEILCHKHIKAFLKMNEIFKHKGYFYFVFQKPHGQSLSILNSVQKLSLPTFLQLMADLLESIWELNLKVENLVILPQWIYFHRKNLKLIHFEPFLRPQPRQQEHVATHSTKNLQINPEVQEQAQGVDFVPQQYKKNLILNIGLIAFRLITGKKQQNIQTKEQYQLYAHKIRQICQIQVARETDEPRIASFIAKMVSKNKYQAPTLEQVKNFFQAKNRDQKKIVSGKALTVQIEMQKINLTTARKQNSNKKKTRPCCIQQQKLTSREEIKMKNMGLKSQNQLNKIRKSKLLLPYLSLHNKSLGDAPQSLRYRNLSIINRHHPFKKSSKRQLAFRQHIQSVDGFKNEEYF